MTNAELILALANMFQVLALAYIGLRQAEVKKDLRSYNGRTLDELEELRAGVDELRGGGPPPGPPLRGLRSL